MPFAATWMDLEIVRLSEVSKSDGERQISYNITYMWNLTKRVQMNSSTKQKQSYRYRKQTYGYQHVSAGRDKLGDQDKHIHTTIYKINN